MPQVESLWAPLSIENLYHNYSQIIRTSFTIHFYILIHNPLILNYLQHFLISISNYLPKINHRMVLYDSVNSTVSV